MDIFIIIREDITKHTKEENLIFQKADLNSLFMAKKIQNNYKINIIYITTEDTFGVEQLKAFGANRILRLIVTKEMLSDENFLSKQIVKILKNESFSFILLGKLHKDCHLDARLATLLNIEGLTALDELKFVEQNAVVSRVNNQIKEQFVINKKYIFSIKNDDSFKPIISIWDVFSEKEVEVIDFDLRKNNFFNKELSITKKKIKKQAKRIYNDIKVENNVAHFLTDLNEYLSLDERR